MTKSNLVLVAAAAALTFGVMGNTATPNSPLSKSDSLIAGDEGAPSNTSTDENAEDSAKMGKEEGTHIHKVEVLAGLESGERPIQIGAADREVLAPKRELSSRRLPHLLDGLALHRQAQGEIHPPRCDRLGRQRFEEFLDGELRQSVVDVVTGETIRKVRLDTP